jgi:hypothetical protein
MEKVLRWIGMVGHTDQRPSAWRIQISERLPSFLVQVHGNGLTNHKRDPGWQGPRVRILTHDKRHRAQ